MNSLTKITTQISNSISSHTKPTQPAIVSLRKHAKSASLKAAAPFLLALVLTACQTTPKCGQEMRGAFDIGSGSTKVKVVEVNTCVQAVTRHIFEDQVKVDYRDSLDKSSDKTFSPQIRKTGIQAILNLKASATKAGAQKFSGVATAAFRHAKNGEEFADEIAKTAQFPVTVISQDREALLGAKAAREKLKVETNILVWDIGGGSQQMTSLDENSQSSIYYGDLASVSFKNLVIAEIQKKNVKKVVSPNPMTKAHVEKAVQLAIEKAKNSVPESIQSLLKANPNMVVVGIGGVLAKSLPRQLNAQTITVPAIDQAIEKRHTLTDRQLNDPYAATEITNLILVKGFMQSLGIRSFQAMDVGLVDGLWFDSEAWPSTK